VARASTRNRQAVRRSPRGRPPAGRPAPQAGWFARHWYWAGVAVVAAGVVALAASGGGTDEGGVGGLTGGDFHSLAVDPTDPQRVFVGGHQAVSVSSDGGATWEEVDSLRDADAMGWALVGDDVYVSGHPGLNESTDGGRSFERVNQGLPHTDVHAFGGTDEVLYGASPAVGVFAGQVGDWEVRTEGAGQSFFGRIVVDPADDQHLFAADAAVGVAESHDGGRNWQLLDSGLPAAVWMSRGGDGLEALVASGPEGAVLSTDGGASWDALDLPEGVTLVEAVPGDSDLLYAGRHNGSRVQVYVSQDGGETWDVQQTP
jgi:hypothetical protein